MLDKKSVEPNNLNSLIEKLGQTRFMISLFKKNNDRGTDK